MALVKVKGVTGSGAEERAIRSDMDAHPVERADFPAPLDEVAPTVERLRARWAAAAALSERLREPMRACWRE